MSQQDGFAEDKWPDLRREMEAEGPEGVAAFIGGFDDPLERRSLYLFAHRAFSGREWKGKSLDKIAQLTRCGIGEMMAQSSSAGSEETANERKNDANVMSFNLAADLADCWPGDDALREQQHFELGLKAAEDCIRWREELGIGPDLSALAWWAKGMHELSLARSEASASFRRSRDLGIEGARMKGHDTSITSRGHWSVLLAEGYLAIARNLAGDNDAPQALRECYRAIEEGVSSRPEDCEDLQFCLDQLRKVEGKYLSHKG